MCSHKKKNSFLNFPFCQTFSTKDLLFYIMMPCLVRLSLISFLNGTTNSAISSRTLWTIFWLAKTSNKPISLTTWLAVNPKLDMAATICLGPGFSKSEVQSEILCASPPYEMMGKGGHFTQSRCVGAPDSLHFVSDRLSEVSQITSDQALSQRACQLNLTSSFKLKLVTGYNNCFLM